MFRLHFLPIAVGSITWMATLAHAELNAQQVWQDIEQQFKDAGYMVAATPFNDGKDLKIRDLQIAQIIPDTETQVIFDIGQMVFEKLSDGRVSIIMPDSYPIYLRREGSDENNFALTLTQYSKDLTVFATEQGDAMSYAYLADYIGFRVKDFEADDFDANTDSLVADLRITDITATMTTQQGEVTARDTAATFGAINFDMSAQAQVNDQFNAEVKFAVNAITYAEQLSLPKGASMMDPDAAMLAGLTYNTVFGAENIRLEVDAQQDADDIALSFGSGPLDTTLSYSSDHIYLQGNANDMQFDLLAPDLPLPVNGTLGKASYNFDIPLSAQPKDQAFGLGMSFTGLGMSDSLWTLFDPQAYLSRDPLGLSFKVIGTGRLGVNLLEMDRMKREPEYIKDGELKSLRLEDFVIEGLGARVMAQGDFTFDNSDLETFDGMPRPQGSGTVVLNGLNDVMSSLLDLGLIDESQMFMARMMVGGFMMPTGDDELTSEFKITPDGEFFANGQRLR